MAKNTVFEDGDYLSLPVPSGVLTGEPVRVGGLNGVAQTDRGEGGNDAGNASVMLKGVHDLTVTDAIAAVGDPVYITAARALTNVATGNSLFGHALETKAAAAGVIRVRIAN